MIFELTSTVSCAAYVAGVTEREVNRIFDEGLLPPEVTAPSRALTPLGCVLASFYFRESACLTADLRKRVVNLLARRGRMLRTWAALATLSTSDWDVELGTLLIHFAPYVTDVISRGQSLACAEALVESSPDVFDGEPVFKGTRVPVRTIASWVDAGVDRERIRESYPHVTDDMIAAASVWAATHPQRGRPRKFSEINPGWKIRSAVARRLKAV